MLSVRRSKKKTTPIFSCPCRIRQRMYRLLRKRKRVTVTESRSRTGMPYWVRILPDSLNGKRMVLEYRPATEADQERIEQEGGIFEVTAYRVNMISVLKVDVVRIGTAFIP